MNQRTAKLIKKYARVCKFPVGGVRDLWSETPRPQRGEFRRMMKRRVAG